MISKKHKFVFIHISKTGGLSIRNVLRKFSDTKIKGWPTKPSHSKYKEYARDLDLSDYYVFSCVRNPWDRLVSMYSYWRQETGSHPHNHGIDQLTRKVSFKDWIKHIDGINTEDEDFRHIQNQCEWLEDEGGEIKLNKIIRFEQIDKGFEEVCADLSIGGCKLPHRNKSKHKDYRSYYDDGTRKIVGRMFRRDISEFGFGM